MLTDWSKIRYFRRHEFDSPDSVGSGAQMQHAFLLKLDMIRGNIGRPITITSGYRTEQHNREVGGVDSSSHTKGLAADISCRDNQLRMLIVKRAIDIGINRIGIGKSFVHLDIDPDLPPWRIWVY